MIALAADAAAKLNPYNLSDDARQTLYSNNTKMLIKASAGLLKPEGLLNKKIESLCFGQ